MNFIKSIKDVQEYDIKKEERLLHSAQHEDILSGVTTDIYFITTMNILEHMGIADKEVVVEIFARKSGVFVGIEEVKNILKDKNIEMWALEEGSEFEPKETLVRIKGPYKNFAIYESIILGCLASPSGWATASKEVKEACGEKGFICFGTRHVHPSVAPVMERAAKIGGAGSVSNILTAKLIGENPTGTLPHAAFLVAGDTLEVAKAYDEIMPNDYKRIVLVDTFKDEVEETLRLAKEMGERLYGIRLDTPSERGGVTPELVKEIRARLDLEGYNWVKIFVSGGLKPDKIKILSEAGVDSFGVGSYISGAPAIDMTMDIKEIEGKPVAKRGRIPGIISNQRLVKML
ncbi:nicotinate phosphoribosyltransferase PncB [Gottschalkia purinilytica]|uniref:nicotinate phosphoribosyltransferase n=1 Tax=Gottschalkia purinilytica TaxID=1503 RepID=A0A0L0WDC8_GOTPU|nr:nicotinate phosphoribosyltransferase [Gottschalkia purinilytica]KNF09474.1 nicotinate phosphoribosyltransferase PncB [Gottschalkia purinilytica]